MSKSKAAKFIKSALAAIESNSIREWASSAHNTPIVAEMAAHALSKNPNITPDTFAAYLVVCAMG